ncbi:unnamed protein product [Cyprideis torosa]|uniref:Uncharacterized protein n=1 Tax=Cyprideis torosa TaxID=163714 RepID=A0A7R8W182_9CRUS|nr:unnamed protein product [Cyprideis torosa]CAG0879540.1 unnamed protein product [Cyprideis torosa]
MAYNFCNFIGFKGVLLIVVGHFTESEMTTPPPRRCDEGKGTGAGGGGEMLLFMSTDAIEEGEDDPLSPLPTPEELPTPHRSLSPIRAMSEPPPEDLDISLPSFPLEDSVFNDGYYGSVETLPTYLDVSQGPCTEEAPCLSCDEEGQPRHRRLGTHYHGHRPGMSRQPRLIMGGRIPIKPVRIRRSSVTDLLLTIRHPPTLARRVGRQRTKQHPSLHPPRARSLGGAPFRRRGSDDFYTTGVAGGERSPGDSDSQEDTCKISSSSSSSSSSQSSATPTPRQRIALLASIAIVNFTSFCCLSVLAPFFPREVTSKGLSLTVAGAIFSVYSFISFLSPPLLGKMMPLVGTRYMFLSGSFLCGGCCILFGFVYLIDNPTSFIVYCVLIRSVEALGASAFQTAAFTLAIVYFPDNIGSVMGLMETFVGIGLSVGPALGGFLYSLGGFLLPFVVLGSILLLSVPINLFLIPSEFGIVARASASSPTNSPNGSSVTTSVSFFSILKTAPVIVTCIVIILGAASWTSLDPTLEPHLREFDLTPSHLGMVFLLLSGIYAIFSPFWGWIADRMNRLFLMTCIGLMTSGVCLLFLGPSPLLPFLTKTLPLILAVLAALGCTISLCTIPTYQMLLDGVTSGGLEEDLATHAMVSGLWVSMYSLGECIGPAVAGVLIDHYGFAVMSTTFGLICIVSGGIGCVTSFTWSPISKMDEEKELLVESSTSSGPTSVVVVTQRQPSSCMNATTKESTPLIRKQATVHV